MKHRSLRRGYLWLALIVTLALLLGGGAVLAERPFLIDGPPIVSVAPERAAGTARVMVEYRVGQGPAVQAALARAGGEIHHAFDDLRVFAVTLPTAALQGIQNNPHVVAVAEDVPRYPMGQTTPWGIERVQAPTVWESNVTGSGVRVCVIDSGLYTAHEDVAAGNVIGGYPSGWNTDGCGHGTHVAGTIAAIDNTVGVVGVSPDVSLYIVKVFGDNCSWSYSSDLIDATNRCKTGGADIISMSLGGGKGIGPWEERQFNALYNDGILSVAAAGNAGNTQKSYPASYGSVISVAALDSTNTVASFSQQNDQVELAAPGVDVLSTVPWNATASLTVEGVAYNGNHIENAAYGSANGTLADGGRCTATGAWSSQVVLCERGDVSFYDKVRNVQNSGGVAAVIYNNEPGGFIGTLGDQTSTIPAISLSQADGQYLVKNKIGVTGDVVSTIVKPASGYEAWNGTSMATPHVSGVAALLWSYNPSLTNAQIRDAMNQTALDLGPAGRDNAYGYGLVQAYDALVYLGGGGEPPTPPAIGTIAGKVTADGGDAIAGATVTINETGQSASTGDDGSYSLSEIEVGSYTVTASKAGYVSQTLPATVTEDTTALLDFVLSPTTVQTMSVDSVTVTVVKRGRNAAATAQVTVLSNGNPVSGALVSGDWYFDKSQIGTASGTTDANGVASISSGNVRAASGTFRFCVTDVILDGYLWNGTEECGDTLF